MDPSAEQERRRGVGELVCVSGGAGNLAPRSTMPHYTEAEKIRILDYFELTGKGSIVATRRSRGFSRSTTGGELDGLSGAGHGVPLGKTSILAAPLNQAQPLPQLIGRN